MPDNTAPSMFALGRIPENSGDELLALLGPSWAAMTSEQRAAYGPDHTPSSAVTVDDCAELVGLALDFPQTIRTDGLVAVAERWAHTESAVALARRIAAPDPVTDALVAEIRAMATPHRAAA